MESLPIDQLLKSDTDYDLFALSPLPSPEALRLGLIPPLPLGANGLICGFAVARAAAAAGFESLPIVRLALDPAAELETALRLENRTDALTWAETAAVRSLILRRWGEAALERFRPLVSVNPNAFERAAVYAAFPPTLRCLVDAGRIDLRSAEKVGALPEAALAAVAERGSQFTVSELRLFLLQLFEIGRRDKLNEADWTALANELLAAPDPHAEIRRRRYPMLTAKEERFRALEKNFRGGLRIAAPVGFEGDRYVVSFDFTARTSYEQKVARLARLGESVDALLALL